MKSLLLFAFLLPGSLSYCQIIFEEFPIPPDFNIESIRQSPIGEYFVQAVNDHESIYTSPDGVEWTKEPLPVDHIMDDIQFLSDGTPLLQSVHDKHLIRRNGTWFTLPGGWENAEASFAKEDTLFIYHDKKFAYSLDKGISFTTVFRYPEHIDAQTAHLYKPANHFILHYTSGSHDTLSVFDETGNRIRHFFYPWGPSLVYNDCGQLLLYSASPFINHYYVITEPGLQTQQGYFSDIFPNYHIDTEILSADGHFFLRDNKTIYRSTGCNFEWEELAANDLIDSSDYVWFSQTHDIFLYDKRSNHFFKKEVDSVNWERHYPDIDYPYVFKVGESTKNDQFVLTSNYLFHKNSIDPTWEKTDSIGGLNYEVQYSPDGDLYINKHTYLQYSQDNGDSYSIIEIPQGGGPYGENSMQVLDNDIIFMSNRLSGESYYTLNNGQDWILTGIPGSLSYPVVKLVNNDILLVDFYSSYTASKINITTNEVITDQIGNNFTFLFGVVILDDGTVYFQTYNILTDNENLYRYKFGDGVKYLGHFNELRNANSLAAVGHDLYAFSWSSYYVFDGENIQEYGCAGLPGPDHDFSFTISDNNFVYAILDHNRIFRSVNPTVSNEEPEAPIDVNIYPNPANTLISLTISESDLNRFDSYEIIDMLGCRRDQSNAFNGRPINVSHLTPGMYTLLLKENQVVSGIGKFIKL